MKAKKVKSNFAFKTVCCRGCSANLEINAAPQLKQLNSYQFQLGIDYVMFNFPEMVQQTGTRNFDNFVLFCQRCYSSGHFFNFFNCVYYDFYLREKQAQNQFLNQKDEELSKYKKKNEELLANDNYLTQKMVNYQSTLKKIKAQEKMSFKINTLKKKLHELQFKINQYVQASQNILTKAQLSQIIAQNQINGQYNFINQTQLFQTSPQQIQECDKTIYNLCQSLTQDFENNSVYQIDIEQSIKEVKIDKNSQIFTSLKKQYLQASQRPAQAMLAKVKKIFESQIQDFCADLQKQYAAIDRQSQQDIDLMESLKQQFSDFIISLNCSSCQRTVFIHRLHYKKLGQHHLKLQLNFCIFNSAFREYKDPIKGQYNLFNSFEVFCQDCYKNGNYFQAFNRLHKTQQIIATNKLKIVKTCELQPITGVKIQQHSNLNNFKQIQLKTKKSQPFKGQNHPNNKGIQHSKVSVKKQQLIDKKQQNSKIKISSSKQPEMNQKKESIVKPKKSKDELRRQRLNQSTYKLLSYLQLNQVWRLNSQMDLKTLSSLTSQEYIKVLEKIYGNLCQQYQIIGFTSQFTMAIDGQDCYQEAVERHSLLDKAREAAFKLFQWDQEARSKIIAYSLQVWVPTDDPADYWDRFAHIMPDTYPQFPEIIISDAKNQKNKKVIYKRSSYW